MDSLSKFFRFETHTKILFAQHKKRMSVRDYNSGNVLQPICSEEKYSLMPTHAHTNKNNAQRAINTI